MQLTSSSDVIGGGAGGLRQRHGLQQQRAAATPLSGMGAGTTSFDSDAVAGGMGDPVVSSPAVLCAAPPVEGLAAVVVPVSAVATAKPGGDHDIDSGDDHDDRAPLTATTTMTQAFGSSSSVALGLLREAAPIAGSMLTFFASQAITLSFVGHRLGTTNQAAFAVALSVFNVTGMSIAIGFLSGLDTLCSQAHGAGREIAPIVHRGVALALGLCVPVVALFFTLRPALVAVFGDDVGSAASTFLESMPGYLVVNTVGFGISRAFQAHQATHLTMYASVGLVLATPLAGWAFIREALGVSGAALATTASMTVSLAITAALAAWHPDSKLRAIPGWTADPATRTLSNYLRVVFDSEKVKETALVSVPALAAVCSEWWAFEVLLLIVGAGAPAALTDAYSCSSSMAVMFIAVPMGISNAAAARLGNALGAGDAAAAASWRTLALKFAVAVAALDVVVLLLFGGTIVRVYTTDDTVIDIFKAGIAAMALLHFCDCIQLTCQGLFRTAGQQRVAAVTSLGTLWVVALPLAAVLTHRAETPVGKLLGALLGMATGLCLTVGVLAFKSARWDWNALVAAALARERADESKDDPQQAAEDSQELATITAP